MPDNVFEGRDDNDDDANKEMCPRKQLRLLATVSNGAC